MESKKYIDLMREQPYAYWLHSIQGIGNKTIQKLLSVCKTAENVYDMADSELKEYLKPKQLEQLRCSKKTWNLSMEYDKLENNQIAFYTKNHPHYPNRLRNTPDAPYAIYVRGKLPLEQKTCVAIIGARLCSEYGCHVARQYGRELAKAGVQVVSGLARGIDGISQRAAIEAGGNTYAVLGCGVDICYPQENIQIYKKISEQGGIVSEYIPGTLPKPQNFPPRNRIISGLSDAVLVIEAKQRSGTLITVDMALEQGREVYAIPGRVTDALSFGCNRLIEQGAGITLSPADLLEQLASIQEKEIGQRHHTKKADDNFPILPDSKEGEFCKSILSCLDHLPQSADTIRGKIIGMRYYNEVTIPYLLQQLLYLQMRGYVEQKGGQYCLSEK